MSDTDSTTPRRTGWRLWASLLANMLLIGVIAGAVINRDPRGDFRREGPPPMQRSESFAADRELAEAIFASLPPSERRQARRELRRSWAGLAERRQAFLEARKSLSDALNAEPFDADAVAEAMGVMREEELAVRLELEKRLLALLERLDPETRAELVERFDNPPQRRRFRRGDGPPGRGFPEREPGDE